MEPSALLHLLSEKKLKSVAIPKDVPRGRFSFSRKTKDLNEISTKINNALNTVDFETLNLKSKEENVLILNLDKINKKIDRRNTRVEWVENHKNIPIIGKLLNFLYRKEKVDSLNLPENLQLKEESQEQKADKEQSDEPQEFKKEMPKPKAPKTEKHKKPTKEEKKRNAELQEMFKNDPRVEVIGEDIGNSDHFVQNEFEKMRRGEAKVFLYLRDKTRFTNMLGEYDSHLILLGKDFEGERVFYYINVKANNTLETPADLKSYDTLDELINKKMKKFVFEKEEVLHPNKLSNDPHFVEGTFISIADFNETIKPQKIDPYIFYSIYDNCYLCHYNWMYFPFEPTQEGFELKRVGGKSKTFDTPQELIDYLEENFPIIEWD